MTDPNRPSGPSGSSNFAPSDGSSGRAPSSSGGFSPVASTLSPHGNEAAPPREVRETVPGGGSDPATGGHALIGRVVKGRYKLKRLVGEGGMGGVYEGEHLEIGKRVAVKLVHTVHARDPHIAARIRQEARSTGAIESENIVQVFDAGEDEDLGLFLVMELLKGEDLSSLLGRKGRISPVGAVSIIIQAAQGLAKAHAAGIVHRDLKPANIFLCTRDDGSTLVKLVDFGIAKLLRDANRGPQTPGLTRMGMVIGTPQYMSPEQAQGLPSVDHATDIYSLGAVLFETMVGTPPFPEMPTYEQTILQIVTTQAPRLSSALPGVHPGLDQLCADMMARDPHARPADMSVVRDRLQRLLPEISAGVGGVMSAVPGPSDTLGAARSHAPSQPDYETPLARARTAPSLPPPASLMPPGMAPTAALSPAGTPATNSAMSMTAGSPRRARDAVDGVGGGAKKSSGVLYGVLAAVVLGGAAAAFFVLKPMAPSAGGHPIAGGETTAPSGTLASGGTDSTGGAEPKPPPTSTGKSPSGDPPTPANGGTSPGTATAKPPPPATTISTALSDAGLVVPLGSRKGKPPAAQATASGAAAAPPTTDEKPPEVHKPPPPRALGEIKKDDVWKDDDNK